MLPRNPFHTTYAEMVDSSDTFLALFDHTAMDIESADEKPLISEDMFERVVFFSSSPGGGKSSIFHFFSPDVLNTVVQMKNQNNESYNYLNRLGVVEPDAVKLLGVQISCARNYEIIEDIYEDGISTQIFFALLNVRILKETLKSILVLKKADTEDLKKITIAEIPEELSAIFGKQWTGADYYNWACQEEKKLCTSINNMESSQPIDFMHSYLSIIQLFDAHRILYDGEKFVDKVLFMFDDVHKLTQRQRGALRESLLTVRARVGVWLAQRSYALEENELLGRDGNIGRDYLLRKLEDLHEGRKVKAFQKTLETIADRRARANTIVEVSSFKSCISESIDWSADKECATKLEVAFEKLWSYLRQYMSDADIENQIKADADLYFNTITLRVIKILIDRKIMNQQITIDNYFIAPTNEEVIKAEKDGGIRSIAEYYLCIENAIPFYYGMDKLLYLSFNNVYQFLNYCGEIFERRLSYKYGSKKRQTNAVPPADQERIISRLSQQYWNELDVMYSNAQQIKTFLENIATIGVMTRDVGTGSYSGGTYTGIGIREPLFNSIVQNEEYKALKSLLATCVSGNLLRMKKVKQGNKDELVTIFYLNRWICVHFKLPLAYGGWKPCNADLLNFICNARADIFKTKLNCFDV